MSEENVRPQPISQESTIATVAHPDGKRSIQEITNEILEAKGTIICSFIEIGKSLDEAKGLLKKDGQWLKWLESRVNISVRMAQRCIQLAKAFPDATSVSHIGMTKALALLALPEAEREDFIKTPHEINGQQKLIGDMSVRELKRIIQGQTNPVGVVENFTTANSLPASSINEAINSPNEAAVGIDKTSAESCNNTEAGSKPMNFKPILSDAGSETVLLSKPNSKSLAKDIQSAQTQLDCILQILKSQASDDEAVDCEIADSLRSLSEKVQKCLALINLTE